MAGATKPVQDIPILMTRPKGSNRSFVDRISPDLREHLDVICSPLIKISGLDGPVRLGSEEAVIFTSANGVRFAPEGNGRRAYCVGDNTTEAARKAGWNAQCGGNDAGELINFLLALRPTSRLHHLSGIHQRGDISARLVEEGLTARRTAIYDQIPQQLSDEARSVVDAHTPCVVPLFSPRTAKHFASQVTPSPHVSIVALSDAVAAECTSSGLSVVATATKPSALAMVKSLEKHLAHISLG